MTRSEIARKVDSIVEFAGVLEYIDVPVKRYSSGMYVRLGFSNRRAPRSRHSAFGRGVGSWRHCFPGEVSGFNWPATREWTHGRVDLSRPWCNSELCDRVILLHHGQVLMTGTPTDVIDHYQQMAMGERKPII